MEVNIISILYNEILVILYMFEYLQSGLTVLRRYSLSTKGSMEGAKKLLSIIHSSAIPSIMEWSKCVHKSVVNICFLNMLSSIIALGITVTTKCLVDGAVSADRYALVKYGLILGGLILLDNLFATVLSMLRIRASAKLQRSMQSMLIKELLQKDYSSLKGYHSGDIVNRFFSDVSVVKNGVLSILPDLLSMAVSFIGAVLILLYMDWRFIILLIIGAIIGLGMVLLFREPMKRRHKQRQEAEGTVHAGAQEILGNIRIIKASGSERRARYQMANLQRNLEGEQIRQGFFSTIVNNGIGMMFDLSWFLCMIWGCVRISSGNLTYGSLAAIIQLIRFIQSPIANAAEIASETYGAASSAERIKELTDLPEEEVQETLTDFDEICINNITFQYDDGVEEVLQDVSCTIKKGDFVALTGMSGGGKSSLFQLLLGIYKPNQGEIIFKSGDKEVKASNGTRGLFAYVPQGNTLFYGSLRDNLIGFTDEATDEEILEACSMACIDDVVREIGLETLLGERGVGLSEGQAQRVGVARAILTKAPILLLDEATSALDEATEIKLLANISKMRDKTCIIVTHRRAALDICDYCLHIKNRRMTEETIME